MNALRVPVQTHVRHGLLGLWAFGLSMAGSLLTVMAALGAIGSGGSPEGPKSGEGAAKRLDAPLPTAHPVSYM